MFLDSTLTWTEAQQQCQSNNMTLFQYGTQPSMYNQIRYFDDFLHKKYYETATHIGEAIYLGLKRNSKVNIFDIY